MLLRRHKTKVENQVVTKTKDETEAPKKRSHLKKKK